MNKFITFVLAGLFAASAFANNNVTTEAVSTTVENAQEAAEKANKSAYDADKAVEDVKDRIVTPTAPTK